MRTSNTNPRRWKHPKAGEPESRRRASKSDRIVFLVIDETFVRAAVGEQDVFEPGVRCQAVFERVVGWVVNEGGFVGLHEEEKLIAVNEAGGEPFVHARLIGQLAVHVYGGIERVMRRVYVMRQNRGRKPHLAPIVVVECVGKLLTVQANLPWEQTVLLERTAIEFCDGGIVLARQSQEWKLAVVVELDKIRAPGRRGAGG